MKRIHDVFLLLSVIVLSGGIASSNAHAGSIHPGEKVDLACTPSMPGARGKIEIVEVGRVNASAVPREVPEIFMKQMEDDSFYIRKFVVNGSYTAKMDGKAISGVFKNEEYFGNLSKLVPDEGIQSTAIYTDYSKPTPMSRAFSIGTPYQKPGLKFEMDYSTEGYSTTLALDCSGTIPEAASVRCSVPAEAPFHREFSCSLKESSTLSAIDFSFSIRNLHHEKLVQGVALGRERKLVSGIGVSKHAVSALNGPDGGITLSKKSGNLRIVGDSDGVVLGYLDLKAPSIKEKRTFGTFRYKVDGQKAKSASVTCTLSEIE